MTSHDVIYSSQRLILYVIVVPVEFTKEISLLQPRCNVLENLHLTEKYVEQIVALEISEHASLFNCSDCFLISHELLEAHNFVQIRLRVLPVEALERKSTRVLFFCLLPPPVLINVIIIFRETCINMLPD